MLIYFSAIPQGGFFSDGPNVVPVDIVEDKEIHNRKNVIRVIEGEEDWLVSFSVEYSLLQYALLEAINSKMTEQKMAK